VVDASPDAPLSASSPEVPDEHAIRGFAGARAYASNPDASAQVLTDVYGFEPAGSDVWTVRGADRGGFWAYDRPPAEPAVNGAGVVHHIAFASQTEEQQHWYERIVAGGLWPSPVIDRFWFQAIYAREPSGVLFEVATLGPGFTTDEPLDQLGQKLVLPPQFEELRERIEAVLTPLPPTRPAAPAAG
jgi:glyoxalase family protein